MLGNHFSCWVPPFQLGFPLFSPSILGVLYPYFLETPIINPYNSSIPKPPQLGRHLHRGKNPPRICGLFFFSPLSSFANSSPLWGKPVGRSVGWVVGWRWGKFPTYRYRRELYILPTTSVGGGYVFWAIYYKSLTWNDQAVLGRIPLLFTTIWGWLLGWERSRSKLP